MNMLEWAVLAGGILVSIAGMIALFKGNQLLKSQKR